MARGAPSLLVYPTPSAASPARVTIGHVQLRDVLICPHEKGIVTYPQNNFAIVEHDILLPDSTPRQLAELDFIPNSIAALNLPNSNDTLLAAGGQDAELYLSLFSSTIHARRPDGLSCGPTRGFGRKRWEFKVPIEHGSINNSVLLTSLNLAGSHESSVEPRVIISNNDRTVKFFDVAVRNSGKGASGASMLRDVGQLRLDVPVNHSSISPDGRTLLCVGDSPDVFLHRVTGGSRITVSPIMTLSLAPYISFNSSYTFQHASGPTVPASFSTSFSGDGSKFAVASQEGVVAVWDVRSTKPLKVIQTDKTRPSRAGSGAASGWLDGPWDWTRGTTNAPGWGVRSIKFSPAGTGREVMTFTEHTSLLHVVDARTFETEEIVRMPDFEIPAPSQAPLPRPRSISPPFHNSTSAEVLPPPPPRIVLFSGALEDTFRIPTESSNGRRRLRSGRRPQGREDAGIDEDVDGIVVIPPLGDPRIEDDVRRLLGRHGLRTRAAILDQQLRDDGVGERGTHEQGDGAGEEMDVDELESDCFSSHTPSRASSPVPPTMQPSSTRLTDHLRLSRPGLLARRESTGPYSTRRSAGALARRHRRSTQAEGAADVDQDLAGTCFDPSGTCVYVASIKGIAEWSVRGAEQRWWTDPSWA
ncbi:uncharacterized protein FIBRA_03982 [Fibroporia radiculosa]|uniref:DUF2415 domain-containing protein n=1 Tax=Fibroporia radiculosa TaxID=599839 RepID=J4I9X3_9APHY|nr:uncharacterized protein FIBRA_03982 [Fibroporia radiculosa]CCM01911.1 predicted protein [Fibroporia radiculosa]